MKLFCKFVVLMLALFQNIAFAGCEHANVEKFANDLFYSHRNFYSSELSEVRSLLTPEFYTVLENEYACISQGEICAIEADPWLSAQDGVIAEPINFIITSQTALNVSVKMSYVFMLSETQKESRAVTLQFQKISKDSCWLLADFITPNEGSLKEFIKTWQSEYGKAL